MIFAVAPGTRAKPIPKGLAILFLAWSPVLLYLAYDLAFIPPTPRVLTCTRSAGDAIACQPGDLRGPRAVVEHRSGRSAKDCFVLVGDSRWQCTGADGAAAAAVARVNALAAGASAEIDLTEKKIRALGLLPFFFALTMLNGALRRLRQR